MLYTYKNERIKTESFVKDSFEATEFDTCPIHTDSERNGRIDGLF